MEPWELIASLLRGDGDPEARAYLRNPRPFPGQAGAPAPGNPIPAWVGETRQRSPMAGFPRPPRPLPALENATGLAEPPPPLPSFPFPMGTPELGPAPWEGALAERLPLSAVTGIDPALAADLATAMMLPSRLPPPHLSAGPELGGPRRGFEPASHPDAPRTEDFDEEWNAALARARARGLARR